MVNPAIEHILTKYTEGPEDGLFTDGGARPNPGPGGWGWVLVEKGNIVAEAHGFAEDTTNNRMELTALLEGLRKLPADSQVAIYSDSNLCVQTFNTWAHSWKNKGWKRKTGEIANLDLVKAVYAEMAAHPEVSLQWIKAHNGWRWNEYVDCLASLWAV